MNCIIRRARPEDAAALLDYDIKLFGEPELMMPLQSDYFKVSPEGQRTIPEEALDASRSLSSGAGGWTDHWRAHLQT
jgi:hypothetical protein